jgi:hypothetical protein
VCGLPAQASISAVLSDGADLDVRGVGTDCKTKKSVPALVRQHLGPMGETAGRLAISANARSVDACATACDLHQCYEYDTANRLAEFQAKDVAAARNIVKCRPAAGLHCHCPG